MDQSCYKCGHVTEEGRVFCPHCRAPQIRVVISEAVAAAGPVLQTAATAQASPALPASQTVPVLAVPMSWSQAIKPCALAAVLSTLLLLFRLYPIVVMFTAGFLAVLFYRQGRPGVVVKAGMGARLGALSGLLCFAMSSIIAAVGALVGNQGTQIRQWLITSIDQAAARTQDPQMLAVFERFKTPEGIEFLMVFLVVFGLVMTVAMSSISGALAAAIFGNSKKE
jgi:hypothetical protein